MKLYIADKNRLLKVTLPNKVEESFLVNYSTNNIEERIILEAENGKWTLTKSADISFQAQEVGLDKISLEHNSILTLNFSDIEDSIFMYAFQFPLQFISLRLLNKTRVTFGRENCDFNYNSSYFNSEHFVIEFINNQWVIKDNGDERSYLYINGIRTHQTVLNLGDRIFAGGLIVIWMKNTIKVNVPAAPISTTLEVINQDNVLNDENKFTPVADTDKNRVLYSDEEVFFHTPRIKSNIEEKTFKIVAPPAKFQDDSPPLFLTIGSTVIMSISSMLTSVIAIFNMKDGKNTLLGSITELSMCLGMVCGSILFPVILNKYQKRRIEKKEKLRQERYTEYLNQKTEAIRVEMQNQVSILLSNNLDLNELKNKILNKDITIWSREISDNDFLTFRLGIGDVNAQIKIEANVDEFSIDDDNLKKDVENIVNSKLTLKSVPITTSLIENKVLPVIIDNNYLDKQKIYDSIMLQLISYYSPNDLKIVFFTNQENSHKWEIYKYLAHNYDLNMRFFADNEDDIRQVSQYLENIFHERANSKSKEKNTSGKEYLNFDTYYLIITDDYMKAKRSQIVSTLLDNDGNYGFSLLIFEPSLQNIPSHVNNFVNIHLENSKISSKDSSQKDLIFTPDKFDDNMKIYCNYLANIPSIGSFNKISLPQSINFLEMLKVGKIEQLNILNRWNHNDPTQSLHTEIGVHEDGKVFELDLHEKFHGPHGLVAGSTGSGKSEFIITYLLSLAINYHPYEVQFVLIDYKGGGLAGAFENKELNIRLPHLVGTITNLDTSEMNRTLVSINSELKRRQRIFNEARDKLGESTVDIYKYQRFYREKKVSVPISHLFIVSDEFAELKAQQPEFMAELVSAARIGRSLGVHLILATQKPSGVVDDQIWSNAKFKVCLKVATTEDSNELLKKPDAASIKETGRFYLQVGADELFEMGQSAWAGARYVPTNRMFKKIDDSLEFVDNVGNSLKIINDRDELENKIDYGDQLSNIVKTIVNIAQKENIVSGNLWLPSIPEDIYLFNLINKYQYKSKSYLINPILGEYDDPETQNQGLLTVDFTNTGNLLIYGNAGSGKENLLSTLIYSTCISHNTDEVNMYIVDFGAETLKSYNDMPHVGDLILIDDKVKLKNYFLMLDREITKRKELFSDYGGSYSSYIEAGNDKCPLILNIFNGYDQFLETYGEYDDFYSHLLRDSAKYGICFVMTVVTVASVKSRIGDAFNNKIMMKVNDDFDYKFILDAPTGLRPAKYNGRGLTNITEKVLEFQSANIYLKDKINDLIKEQSVKFAESYKKAESIPVIPENITQETLISYIESLNNVPLGISIDDASICTMNFMEPGITYFIGNNILIKNDFIKEFIKIISIIPNTDISIIDFSRNLEDFANLNYSNENFTNTIKEMLDAQSDQKEHGIVILAGIGSMYDLVLDEGIELLNKILINHKKLVNTHFILIDNYTSMFKIMKESWFNNPTGVWVGKGLKEQKIFDITNISKSMLNDEFGGQAYILNLDGTTLVNTIKQYWVGADCDRFIKLIDADIALFEQKMKKLHTGIISIQAQIFQDFEKFQNNNKI